MKRVLPLVVVALGLTACVQLPIVEPLTPTEEATITCRELWKESERLTRIINNVRAESRLGLPEGRNIEVMEAAQKRLEQVRELSVQNMCTYG